MENHKPRKVFKKLLNYLKTKKMIYRNTKNFNQWFKNILKINFKIEIGLLQLAMLILICKLLHLEMKISKSIRQANIIVYLLLVLQKKNLFKLMKNADCRYKKLSSFMETKIMQANQTTQQIRNPSRIYYWINYRAISKTFWELNMF